MLDVMLKIIYTRIIIIGYMNLISERYTRVNIADTEFQYLLFVI